MIEQKVESKRRGWLRTLFRKKTLLATLPDRKVEYLGRQTLVSNSAHSEGVNVVALATFLTFIQEFLGVNILEDTDADKLQLYIKTGSRFIKKGDLLIKKRQNTYRIFATVTNMEIAQEMAKNTN